MQIEPYLKTFGPSNVLPVFVERLHNNPIRELQLVFDFLSVNEKPIWHEDIRSNISSERLKASAWRDAIIKNRAMTIIRRTFIPKGVRNKVRKLWAMKERPKLYPEILESVEGVFNRDLEMLGQKFGLELTCANYKDKIFSRKNVAWER